MRPFFITFVLIGCQPSAPIESAEITSSRTELQTKPESRTEPESAATSGKSGVAFLGSPMDDEHQVPSLVWKSDAEKKLRATCETEPGKKTIKGIAGKPIAYQNAMTVVQHGITLTSTEAHTRIVSPLGKLDDVQPEIRMNIAVGTQIETLKYAGEGQCYIRIENMLAMSDCPSKPQFDANGWDGKSYRGQDYWCVEVKGGWLRIDEDITIEFKE